MKKQKCKGVLGLLAAGLLGLWPVGGLRAQAAATMAAAETSAETVQCDTIRMTWEAKAGEEKSFSFEGVSGGWFTIQWGDGEQTVDVFGMANENENIHTYANAGRYEVLLCGVPYQAWHGENYTERAFGMELEMVAVNGGTFEMGATSEQGSDALSNEKPVHRVALSDFYMGKYEVTQAQWVAVMGTTIEQQRDKADPSWPLYGVGDNYPMYYVSWEEAQEFCTKLSQKTGKTYRLPTEAEWEYAARGGQKADGTKYAGSDAIGTVAWYTNNSGDKTHPVGQKQPNGLGLYDMSGNVWEWCQDWYDSYSSSSAANPQGPSGWSYPYRVYRGGSWGNDARRCRVSRRGYYTPAYRFYDLGFRVVCEP